MATLFYNMPSDHPPPVSYESQYEMNLLGQPVGYAIPGWTPPPVPGRVALAGRFCRVEPLHPEAHAEHLYAANGKDAHGRMWTYLPYGPFETFERYGSWLASVCMQNDRIFYAIVDAATDHAVGAASYLRINPAAGSIEVGSIAYSPALQGTTVATEAMYLMMENIFILGYRRYEWKCNALNTSSRAAAQRLGFSFEGVFRQDCVVKGRNRDTAWYSIIDQEWPALREAFSRWLDSRNFDAEGRQRLRLSDLTSPLLQQGG
jgi:RimJ/RimL family protein N-acetyltransferase